jgi:DNA helicase-2/ATP-dependent DNA helicase PcrA
MAWDDDLLDEQREAARHVGTHARLLAGPGTGKTLTLTRHACFLIDGQGVAPSEIRIVTFTRAAAAELRQRLTQCLGPERLPRISTLHSYALRQLLRNSTLITALPQPLRIADDWEERNIILEDLKLLLGFNRISEIRDLFNELSADWQSLSADETDWDSRFPDPRFLGLWQEHRTIFGYTLRSELVYQLKRALEQHEGLDIEMPVYSLLVDEYQDLNRCDLAVVKQISDRGVYLYIAGDDDQSIYGFRKAHPQGIRRFPQDYPDSTTKPLTLCKRCDRTILDFGLFVARQDYNREEKTISTEEGREGGEVHLLRFLDQGQEARGVAQICSHLVLRRELLPDDILILLRSDHNRYFSSLYQKYIENAGIPVNAATEEMSPFNQSSGRIVLSLLRLAANSDDHLAWRTLLRIFSTGIGDGAIQSLYSLARSHGIRFADSVNLVINGPDALPRFGNRAQREARRILSTLAGITTVSDEGAQTTLGLLDQIRQITHQAVSDEGEENAILSEFERIITTQEVDSIEDLLQSIETSREDIEQEIEPEKVNIMTMHRAKGLTAEAVIVAAAEDQYIPGRAIGDAVGDERRLLYVSLTRARHYLYVTYCQSRTGSQRYTGRNSGRRQRSLTQFLANGPIPPQAGIAFINSLGE